jgi:hypothetical protein
LIGKSSEEEGIRGVEPESMKAFDETISMVVKLLKVPVDILGVETNGVAVLVGEVLGIEGSEVVGEFLDDFHSFWSNLILQIYNFYSYLGMGLND